MPGTFMRTAARDADHNKNEVGKRKLQWGRPALYPHSLLRVPLSAAAAVSQAPYDCFSLLL